MVYQTYTAPDKRGDETMGDTVKTLILVAVIPSIIGWLWGKLSRIK